MQQKLGVLSFVALALILSLSGASAKFYKEFFNISGRQRGDQLVWQSKSLTQNLNFHANVHIELRYPPDQSKSNFMLTNLFVTGQDDTGYIDYKPIQGGPGSDTIRCQIVLNSIKNGSFQAFLYGKKK